MKNILQTSILVVLAVCIDTLFRYFEVPVITMDLLFVPMCCFCIVGVFTPKFLSGEYINWHNIQHLKFLSMLTLISTALGVIVLGIFMLHIGISNPLKLFTGVKGGGHGYTFAIMGLTLVTTTFVTAYVSIFGKMHSKK